MFDKNIYKNIKNAKKNRASHRLHASFSKISIGVLPHYEFQSDYLNDN